MITISESPNRKLRREMGWGAIPSSVYWVPFNCGDIVVRKDDPRHIGRVGGVIDSTTIVVYWWVEYEGQFKWREEVCYRDLRRIRKDEL